MKQVCILHANCQGDPLAFLLQSSPEFAARYAIHRFVNYVREPIPDALLARCSLFLFQPLGDKWDELATSSLAAKLPPEATCLQIPNMFFKGYWPFWTNKSPQDFGDSYLDYLVDQGLSHAEIVRVYLHGRLETKFDLDAIVLGSLAYERKKEQGAVFRSIDVIEALWRSKQLFTTINHPVQELVIEVADAVLAAVGMPKVPLGARRACPPCDAEFALPIHPLVGRHFGLSFVSESRTYKVFGKAMTFAQYTACYVDCRLRRAGNFIAYLHHVTM